MFEFVHNHILRPLYPVPRAVLPRKTIFRLSHRYAKARFLNYLKKRLGPQWVETNIDDGSAMSKRLRLLTRSLDEAAYHAEFSDDQFFYESYCQAYYFFRLMEPLGFNLRTCGSILDFGCGSARILRLYRYIDGVYLVGSDVHPECIEWCIENVPGPEFYVNQAEPPLLFSKDNQFSFVISLSVFNHIPLNQQTAWLEEMKRVLRPGGFLLCTTLGRSYDRVLGPGGHQLIREQKEVQIEMNDERAALSTRAGGASHDIYQRRDRVIDVFGSVLRLRDYIPDAWSPIGQDVLILQKP